MRLIKSNWSASFFNKTNTITDMKRSVLVLSAILFSVLSFAQTEEGTVTVRAGQDLVKILPHNVVYLLPEFMEGTVDFTDGSREAYSDFYSFVLVGGKDILVEDWLADGGYEEYLATTGRDR